MKKRKLLLLFALSLLFTACSGSEKTETTEVAEATEAVTITETIGSTPVQADKVPVEQVFVSPQWVMSVIDGQQEESKKYAIFEVSWGTADESKTYNTGHLPGAVHLNTDTVESEEYWNIRTPEEMTEALLHAGVSKDTVVILYGGTSAAGRVAFAYLWAGVENVKVLDGGLKAWEKAGYPLETKANNAIPINEFGSTVPAHPEYWMSVEDVEKKLNDDPNFKLVSIRSYEEFCGETSGYSYIEKAGEPKGAVWGKNTDSYHHEDGTVITMDEMNTLWNDLGFSKDNELSFYCGTGWRATIPFLIMYQNNYRNMTLYDGGWFQWQMNDELPVQVGDPAKGEVVFTTVKELPNDKAKQ